MYTFNCDVGWRPLMVFLVSRWEMKNNKRSCCGSGWTAV